MDDMHTGAIQAETTFAKASVVKGRKAEKFLMDAS
jgi:hypothetical protein